MMLNGEDSSFKKHAILTALFVLLVIGGVLAFAVKMSIDANARVVERDAKVDFKVYCVASSGEVLFNDTVGVAHMVNSQTEIKKLDSDAYFTSIAGQCKITPQVKS